MSESNRHTLTVTESNVQLTLLSGPVGAAGPNTITSATTHDGTGNISLSNLNTATLTTTGTATIGGAATLSGGAAITGSTSVASGHLSLGDATTISGKIKLGTGGDLEIFHSGSDSYIDDVGVGNLNIRGSANLNLQKYSGETFVTCVADGSVSIYHDNVVKLTTTVSGVNVSGVIQHTVYTAATLPSGASIVAAGMRAFVSDCTHNLSSHHGQPVAGGGANFVPVFYNGTNWIVG